MSNNSNARHPLERYALIKRGTGGDDDRFDLLDFDELKDLPPPKWLIKGLFEVDPQVLVYGPRGCGKTFLVLDWALSVAAGLDWCGHAIKHPGPVVYIAGEGVRGLRKRVAAWLKVKSFGSVPDAFFVREAPQLRNDGEVLEVLKQLYLLGVTPSLIVLDTLARTFVGRDENSSRDMGEWVESARRLQGVTGATILTVHHSGKNASAGERGSTALGGAMDTIIAVEKTAGDVAVRCEKQKDHEEFDEMSLALNRVPLGVEDGEEIVSAVLESAGPKSRAASGLNASTTLALGVLAGSGDGVVKVSEWRKRVSNEYGQAVPSRTFDNWRQALVKGGFVEMVEKGAYSVTELGASAIGLLEDAKQEAA